MKPATTETERERERERECTREFEEEREKPNLIKHEPRTVSQVSRCLKVEVRQEQDWFRPVT